MPHFANKGARTAISRFLILSSVLLLSGAAALLSPADTQAKLTDAERFGASREHGKKKPLLTRGVFLVASHGLIDPNFSRSVVLLLSYGADGASGVIVNRPTTMKLSEAFPDVDGFKARKDALFFGGPVRKLKSMTLLMRLTGDAVPEAERVFDDTYNAFTMNALRRAAEKRSGVKDLRVFTGYAGWAPGQLDAEIAKGGWTVVKASSTAIFNDEPEKVWRRLRQTF